MSNLTLAEASEYCGAAVNHIVNGLLLTEDTTFDNVLKITQDPMATTVQFCVYGANGQVQYQDRLDGVDGISINFNMIAKATVDVYSTLADDVG